MRKTTLQNKKASAIKRQSRENIAKQLKESIEQSEETLHSIAKKSYVTPSVVSRAASGEHNLTIETLGLICNGIGKKLRIE